MRFRGRKQCGTSILESMVAFAIFAVVTLAIFGLAATANHTSKRSELRLKANTLAQNVLLKKCAESFGSLVDGVSPQVQVSQEEWLLPQARYVTKIDPVPGLGGRLKEITVTVTWKYRNEPQSIVRAQRVSRIQP